ncbi:brix domain-containing protein C4F8.04-like [Brassica napus]|uniref:brix domain-containing protein C4F8.04-like n=1 Tax=Brassica napus TaxID=3708 RepID=UPI000BBE6125|nr:brix domain-containing protein C4F8.04-like [Brassica napus]
MTLSNGSLHQIRRRPPETLLPRCGVGMAWAAFHAVEVVSSSRFAHKRIGYHAIAQSFNNQTPVLLMITNQLRKETVRTSTREPDALLIIGLPNGPAAHFKLSYLVLRKDIKNHENLTSHEPELVLTTSQLV